MSDSDCRTFWEEFSSFTYCKKHGLKFRTGDSCPKMPKSDVSFANTKKVVIKHKKVVAQQGVVVDLHQKGCSQSEIAHRLGVSQQYISKILKRFKQSYSAKERFHNFSITFNANVPYDSIDLREVRLKGVSYRNWNSSEFHVQVFKDKVVVRYNKDIAGLKIVRSEQEAINRVLHFVKEWNVYHIVFLEYYISSGHNEFLDNPVAKDLAKKNETIIYKDRADGKDRTIIDFSASPHNPSGKPNFEHVHTHYYNPDSQKWEEIVDDVATGNYDPLHVTKAKLDAHEGVLDKIDKSIIDLTKVTNLEIENKKLHMDVLIEMKDTLKAMRDEKAKPHPITKRDKVKDLLRKFGW